MTLPDLTPAPSLGEVAPPWIVDVRSGDVDEIAHRQRDWRLEYCQLSAGRYDARLRHVQLPGVRLVSESTTCALRQRGQLGERTVGLAIASSPAGASYFHGIAAHDETIMIGGGGDI